MIEEFTKTDSRLAYVDVDAPMIGDDGKPMADLFVKDGVQLNEAGYRCGRLSSCRMLNRTKRVKMGYEERLCLAFNRSCSIHAASLNS